MKLSTDKQWKKEKMHGSNEITTDGWIRMGQFGKEFEKGMLDDSVDFSYFM